jgi:hypothetical protein
MGSRRVDERTDELKELRKFYLHYNGRITSKLSSLLGTLGNTTGSGEHKFLYVLLF